MCQGERRADWHSPVGVEAYRREVEEAAGFLRDEVEQPAVKGPAGFIDPWRVRVDSYPPILRSPIGRGDGDPPDAELGHDFRYEHEPTSIRRNAALPEVDARLGKQLALWFVGCSRRRP